MGRERGGARKVEEKKKKKKSPRTLCVGFFRNTDFLGDDNPFYVILV